MMSRDRVPPARSLTTMLSRSSFSAHGERTACKRQSKSEQVQGYLELDWRRTLVSRNYLKPISEVDIRVAGSIGETRVATALLLNSYGT